MSRARLRAGLAKFARGRSGMAAAEFALIAPVMLSVYLGGVQVGDGVAISRKVTIATRSVADLTTQYSSVTSSLMTTIMQSSSVIVEPYALNNIVVTVSELTTTDKKGDATVTWSQSLNGTALIIGSKVTLPNAGMAPASGISLVWCTISYAYTPSLGYLMTGPFNISDQIFMSPRVSSSIPWSNG